MLAVAGWFQSVLAARPVVGVSRPPMRFAVLGSGSVGNAALVEAGTTRVLVDAGFSARQLRLRMLAAGVEPESLAAVVLTHEHGDHVRGLKVLLRDLDVPVMATTRTVEVLRNDLRQPLRWTSFEAGQSFRIGELGIDTFEVMHDAVDPVGFVFRSHCVSLGFLSDLGHAPESLCSHLTGIDGLFIEANYHPGLLEADTRRPWPTKQRISSRHGHFSNEQAAELIARIAHPRLRRVVLGHLSRDCNRPDLACAAVTARLVQDGWADIKVDCASQDGPGAWHPLA